VRAFLLKFLLPVSLIFTGLCCQASSFSDEASVMASLGARFQSPAVADKLEEVPGSEKIYYTVSIKGATSEQGSAGTHHILIYKRGNQGFLELAHELLPPFESLKSSLILYSRERLPLLSISYRAEDKSSSRIIFIEQANGGLKKIDTSAIDDWVSMELLDHQKLLPGFSGIKLTEDLLFYQGLVINESDNQRSSGGKIYVELKLENFEGNYKLDVINGRSRHVSRSQVKEGRAAYESGDLLKAEELFNQAIQADAESWDAWAYLGQTLVKKGDYAAAIYAAKLVINNEANNEEKALAYYCLGFASELMEDSDSALNYYQKSMALQQTKKTRNAMRRLKGLDFAGI